MSFDCCGDRHGRRYEMRASAGALPPFKVPIAGRRASLSGLKHIGIHRQAHAASGFPPLKSGVLENAIQAFRLGLFLHEPRAGNNHGVHAARHLLPFGILRRQSQILNAGVRAGPYEDLVEFDLGNRHTGRQRHIFQRMFRRLAYRFVRDLARIGNLPIIPVTIPGLVPHVTCGAISSARSSIMRS